MSEILAIKAMARAATADRRAVLSPVRSLTRPAASLGLAATTIRDQAGFAALEAEWRALEARAPDGEFFSSFDWAWCWWDHFGRADGATPAIVALRRSGVLAALMPLAIMQAGPYRYAMLMGAGTGQYGDILVDPAIAGRAELRDALWRAVRETGADTLNVGNVRDDSSLAALIAPHRKWSGRAETACEVATADWPDFDAYMAERPARLRKDLRRRRRRLAEEGAVVYGVVSGEKAIGASAIATTALKRRWLAERGLHGRFLARDGVDGWLADVTARAQRQGRLHFSVLRVGGRLAASQIAFLSARRLVGYFAAFDVALARHSVGRLHLEDHIGEVFERGLTLDLLPPADDYKTEWARPGAAARSHSVPLTPRGRIMGLLHNPRHREIAKQVYLGLPRTMRAGLAAASLAAAARVRRALSGRAARSQVQAQPRAKETAS